MIYFTSDMHYGHKAIIHMCNRPFESVEEMNKVMLQNYNSVVRNDDTVYILGDISHHMKVEDTEEIVRNMNGKKILIKGNHDKNYAADLFDRIKDFDTLSYKGFRFAVMHYPMLSWPKRDSGSIQLHGHVHETAGYNAETRAAGIRRYDVGVDANNFYPVSIENIIEYFDENRASIDDTTD